MQPSPGAERHPLPAPTMPFGLPSPAGGEGYRVDATEGVFIFLPVVAMMGEKIVE